MSRDVIRAFATLLALEGAQGSNAKKALLEAEFDNEALRDLVFAAYGGDVYGSYSTLKFDDEEGPAPSPERFDDFFAMLKRLARREVTGDAAVAEIDAFIGGCNVTEKKWYRRVIDHDLKVGCNKRTFSKVWDFKSLALGGDVKDIADVTFPGVMLCEPKEKYVAKFTGDLLVEPKLDGLRLVFVWEGRDKWSFFSRSGKNDRYNDNLKHIAANLVGAMHVCGWRKGIIDGEVMGETWNSTLAVKRKELTAQDLEEIARCKFHAFDHLTGPDDVRPQHKRRATLAGICGHIESNYAGSKVTLVPQTRVKSLEEARALFNTFLTQGYEGAIVKDSDAVYKFDNKRSKLWIKIKPVDTQDVRVTGFYPGKERTKYEGTLGGFNVIDAGGQEFNVGGGFTDAQRNAFWEGREGYVGKYCEIEFQPDPAQVAKGRFPVFIRWREDLE